MARDGGARLVEPAGMDQHVDQEPRRIGMGMFDAAEPLQNVDGAVAPPGVVEPAGSVIGQDRAFRESLQHGQRQTALLCGGLM